MAIMSFGKIVLINKENKNHNFFITINITGTIEELTFKQADAY